MSPQKQHHVLIIGGGLAGLALSQALRKLSIDSTVFERDASAEGRKQSWAIALEGSLPDLTALLPEDLGSLESVSNNRRMGTVDTACIMDVTTGQVALQWGGKAAFAQPGYLLHANRALLRNFLVPRANVQWNKRFERYEQDADGVTAYFSDGTSARGTALVGVDGAGSPVRSQLLAGVPGAKLVPLPYGVIGSEFVLTEAQAADLRQDSSAFQVSVHAGTMSFLGLREPMASGAATMYCHLYWIDQAAADQDAAYWTQSASKGQLHAKAAELTAGWKGSGKAAMERAAIDDMMQPPYLLHEFVPPDSLPVGRVTLVGDAAHTMTPFRGVGANTALQDAMDLAKLFQRHAGDFQSGADVDVAAMFKEYEQVMLPRGQQMVRMSGRALSDDPTGEKTMEQLNKRYGQF